MPVLLPLASLVCKACRKLVSEVELEDTPKELSRLLKDDCRALTELSLLLEALLVLSVLLVLLVPADSSEIRLCRSASRRPPG